jgi:hypothetical protein
MKTLAATLIFIFTTIISISQTSLDTLVFNRLNEYRSSLSYIRARDIQYQYTFEKDEIYVRKQIGKKKFKVDTVKVLTMVLKNSYDSDYKKFKDTIFYFSIDQKDIIDGNALSKLYFDPIAYKAAENHSKFLVDTNIILLKKGSLFLTHEQPKQIFKGPSERYKYFGGSGLTFENAQIGTSRNFEDLNYKNLEIMATDIINLWKSSKGHNENMINIDVNYSAVCTRLIESNSGVRNIKNYKPFSTMVLIKK